MHCKAVQRLLYRRVDGELAERELRAVEEHLNTCSSCQKEEQSIQTFNQELRAAPPEIQPSRQFEPNFWKKVYERERGPWTRRVLVDLDAWLPAPSLAQAAAVFLLVFVVGGTGGAISHLSGSGAFSTRSGIRSLSGFEEFQGVPTTTLAGTFLKSTAEEMR